MKLGRYIADIAASPLQLTQEFVILGTGRKCFESNRKTIYQGYYQFMCTYRALGSQCQKRSKVMHKCMNVEIWKCRALDFQSIPSVTYKIGTRDELLRMTILLASLWNDSRKFSFAKRKI